MWQVDRGMRVLVCAAMVIASACATPRATRSPADLDGALARWTDGGDRAPSSTALARTAPVSRRAITRDQTAIAIPRGRVIDVRFQDAPLASALTMLADAANVGVVIGEGVEGVVSIDLRRVRPLDAMRALAEAHGVDLDIVGGTLVARRAGL